MKYRIIGDAMQTVALELAAGEAVFSRLGTMLFARGAIKSETTPAGTYWSALTGPLVMQNEPPLVVYRCDSGGGLVGFHAPAPGRIHCAHLDGSARVTVNRTNILAATEGVLVDPVHLEGEDRGELPERLLVTLSGSGWAFLHGSGNLVEFTLKADERMVVDGRMIVALDGGIDYSPKPVGRPGDSGPLPFIFTMHLTGPGRVVLHTLPDP